MRCPDDASTFLIAWARLSMPRTRCGARCAGRWRKESGGPSRPLPVPPRRSRDMCRSHPSERSYHLELTGALFKDPPVGQSRNSPSPAVRALMRAAHNRSSSSGLLPAERTAFQAHGSGMANIPLPNVGQVVLALSAVVQPGDGVIHGSEDIRTDGEESAEDLSE